MSEKRKGRKPKIAVIGLKGLPAYGGSARAGENMIFFLKHEYQFVVFNTDTHTSRSSGIYNEVEQVVFRKFFIGSLNTLYYYLRSAFYCLFRGDYDVIHVFHVDAAFIVPLLRLRYRVVSGHRARPHLAGKWNPLVSWYFRFMEWVFFKMPADVVTSVSKPVVDMFQTHTKRKILFIPNGILFNHNAEELPSIEERDYILFASGRIMNGKGVHIMLMALNKIGYKGRILIIGNRRHSPGYSLRLEQLAESLDVRFIDIIKDKKLLMSYLKNAKLFIFPSFFEGMSNMLLEASSMQVPIISSDIPENKQVFDDDEIFFFKTGNVDDLASKIQYVLAREDKGKEVVEKCYTRLKRDYDWEKISQKYAEIYHWLYKNKKPLNRHDNAIQG